MRLRTIALAAAMTAAAVGLSSTPAQADHSWNNYHWGRTGAVQVQIHSSVTSDWSDELSVANTDWNKSTVLDNTVVAGATDSRTRRRCPTMSGAVRVCNYTYGRNGWAGLASISVSGGHIVRATAKMNDTYLAQDSAAMRQLVMCQEVGHDWGLDHQDENFNNPNLGTCMDYTNNPSTNQHPNQHDYDQLAAIYNHSDAAATTGKAANKSAIRTGNTITIITWIQ